jgi:hypothetical protein
MALEPVTYPGGMLSSSLCRRDIATLSPLRIGSRFIGERAVAVARALAEARRTIADMPANYIRYANSDAKVFGAAVAAPPRTMRELTLDGEVLGQFGSLTVPGQVWRTLQRLGSWVEPVLVNEWARLVRAYGERMGRMISLGEVEAELAWLDPSRFPDNRTAIGGPHQGRCEIHPRRATGLVHVRRR